MTMNKTTTQIKHIAQKFLMNVVQEWGQSENERQDAWHNYQHAAGFHFRSAASDKWISHVVDTMPRGKFEREVEHLTKALMDRNGHNL